MNDILAKVIFVLIKVVVHIYEVLTFIPYCLIFKPWRHFQAKQRIKTVELQKGVYRNAAFPELITSLDPSCSTLPQIIDKAVSRFYDQPSIGWRDVVAEEDEKQPNGRVFKKVILTDYHWKTYGETIREVGDIAKGLASLGISSTTNVVIFSETRPEWMLTALACFKFNFPIVTLYATLGDDAVIHGIKEAEAKYVVTSDQLLPKFKKLLPSLPNVKYLVYMEQKGMHADLKGFPPEVKLISLGHVQEIGQTKEAFEPVPVKPDTLALIMYTSGSTGTPKGVMITHRNLMAALAGECTAIRGLSPNDVYMAYLPLAHILEMACELGCFIHGAKIGYGTPLTLTDQSSKIKRGAKGDASALRPTLLTCVPTIMDRLSKNVWDKVDSSSPLKRMVFHFAYEYKLRKLEMGFDTPVFTKFLFKDVRAILGGNVRALLCGGAPLNEETQRFANVCFCCPVIQGYGLTETCGAGTVADFDDTSIGRAGTVLVCSEIRLRDWTEGGYTVNDKPNPRGEVIIVGDNVAAGYYKMSSEAQSDFITVDGHRAFCSGDIGEMCADGVLKIIDRKKDLVKLQAGEYVSLSKVECALIENALVDQICVYADPLHSFTVAMVVPNPKHLNALAKELKIETEQESTPEGWKKLCRNTALTNKVTELLTETGLKGHLERVEIPNKVTLVPEVWLPDSQPALVTAAMKLKRKAISDYYAKDIAAMYGKGDSK